MSKTKELRFRFKLKAIDYIVSGENDVSIYVDMQEINRQHKQLTSSEQCLFKDYGIQKLNHSDY